MKMRHGRLVRSSEEESLFRLGGSEKIRFTNGLFRRMFHLLSCFANAAVQQESAPAPFVRPLAGFRFERSFQGGGAPM